MSLYGLLGRSLSSRTDELLLRDLEALMPEPAWRRIKSHFLARKRGFSPLFDQLPIDFQAIFINFQGISSGFSMDFSSKKS